jgi:hypothetical protein
MSLPDMAIIVKVALTYLPGSTVRIKLTSSTAQLRSSAFVPVEDVWQVASDNVLQGARQSQCLC